MMNNYCIYIRKRKNKPYCSLLKEEIMFSRCKECVNKEYKEKSGYKKKSPVKSGNAQKNKNIVQSIPAKHSKLSNTVHKSKKRRITVSKETYSFVIERDKYSCRLCGSTNWISLHHILYRSERRDLINNVDNCIMLCENCHRKVHSNKKKWQPILLEMNKIKKDL